MYKVIDKVIKGEYVGMNTFLPDQVSTKNDNVIFENDTFSRVLNFIKKNFNTMPKFYSVVSQTQTRNGVIEETIFTGGFVEKKLNDYERKELDSAHRRIGELNAQNAKVIEQNAVLEDLVKYQREYIKVLISNESLRYAIIYEEKIREMKKKLDGMKEDHENAK
jgi:hypothetical protein